MKGLGHMSTCKPLNTLMILTALVSQLKLKKNKQTCLFFSLEKCWKLPDLLSSGLTAFALHNTFWKLLKQLHKVCPTSYPSQRRKRFGKYFKQLNPSSLCNSCTWGCCWSLMHLACTWKHDNNLQIILSVNGCTQHYGNREFAKCDTALNAIDAASVWCNSGYTYMH